MNNELKINNELLFIGKYKNNSPDKLQMLPLTILDQAECRKFYRRTNPKTRFCTKALLNRAPCKVWAYIETGSESWGQNKG